MTQRRGDDWATLDDDVDGVPGGLLPAVRVQLAQQDAAAAIARAIDRRARQTWWLATFAAAIVWWVTRAPKGRRRR